MIKKDDIVVESDGFVRYSIPSLGEYPATVSYEVFIPELWLRGEQYQSSADAHDGMVERVYGDILDVAHNAFRDGATADEAFRALRRIALMIESLKKGDGVVSAESIKGV